MIPFRRARSGIARRSHGRHLAEVATAVITLGGLTRAIFSTSFVERQNLTMRMSMRRFTRLSNGFSKKAANHAYSVAIHFMHYNFVRIHQTLRVTPAMAVGVTQTLWSLTDMVRVIEDWEKARRAPRLGDRLVG